MAVEILLVRHAESEGNLKGLFIGHTDVGITPLGEEQVKKLTEYLASERIDEIYCSDLKRALLTINPTAKLHGLTVQTDEDLREIFGGEWEGVPFDKIPELFPVEQKKWMEDPFNSAPTNGESLKAILIRVERFLNKIIPLCEGKRIVITSHATTLRVLECYLNGGLEKWGELTYLSNASVSYYVYENGKYTLKKRNVDDFMGDLVTKLPSNI